MFKGYVYKFYNEDNEIIYIGYTKDIEARLKTHFGNNGHLPQKCYSEVERVEYARFPSENEARIYEIYYISKIKPKYNTQYNRDGEMTITLDEPDFVAFDMTKISRRFTSNIITEEELKNTIADICKELTLIKVHMFRSGDLMACTRAQVRDRADNSEYVITGACRRIEEALRKFKITSDEMEVVA